MRSGSPRALVDARTGIIRRIERRRVPDDLPQCLRLVVSVISDASRFGLSPTDPTGSGLALWDEDAAEGAAVGEAVERYCGNLVPPKLVSASYDELVGAGQTALDPHDLALFSPDQYDQTGFPFVPFTRGLRVRWVQGRELVTHRPVWLPASLVFVTYHFPGSPTRHEPPTNAPMSPGVAAGLSREAAEWSALCELIERDAMTLGWISGVAVGRVEPPPWLAQLARGSRQSLDVRFLRFPSEFSLPVIGALMVDQATGFVTMGTACRPAPVDAECKALAEAVQLQIVMRELDDPTSTRCRLASEHAASPLKPWCPDRSYCSQYRSDWRDVTNVVCHLQLYLDPDMRKPLEHALATGFTWDGEATSALDRVVGTRTPTPATWPAATAKAASAAIAACMGEHGIPVYSVDLTTADVRATGLRVIRLVAPGLYSETPAAFPSLGGERLWRVRQAATGQPLRLLPLPH